MKSLDNIPAVLCTLLVLVQVVFSLPRVVDVSADHFMKMKEIKVRANGTPLNTTVTGPGNKDIVCGNFCSTAYTYKKVGDGDPHQHFVITQKGGSVVACDTSASSTSSGYAVSLGWSLSLGVNSEFSSAGFSISESETYSVTNTFTCNNVAAEAGEVCVLFYQAVTAFTVDVTEHETCGCSGYRTIDKGQATVYAPNTDQIGSVAGRGVNVVQHGVEQCVGDSDRTVNYFCGPPGGPEWWNGRGDGPWIDDYVNQREPANCAIPIEANRYTD